MRKPDWLKSSVRARRRAQRLSQGTVLAGPFTGMKLDSPRSYYFLGTYELEIRDVIAQELAKPRPVFVDVGAAEGYYAIGFALKGKMQRIVAYEAEESEQQVLLKNAALNNVQDRLEIRGFAGEKELIEHAQVPGGLLLVDVEGFEKDLFTPELVETLRTWTLLVETHLDPSTSQPVRAAFQKTHRIEEFGSRRRTRADLAHFSVLDRYTLRLAARENRSWPQSWLYMTPL